MKHLLIALCISCSGFLFATGGKILHGDLTPPGSDQSVAFQMVSTSNVTALKIDEYLSAVEAMGFSGAIVAEHEGEVILRKGYGLSDRATRKRFMPETVQTMGSITKQMTAAAILLLEQQGRLSTGDLISHYFDPVPADKAGITIHHLLTHQAGFPGALGRDAEAITAPEYIARAMEAPLEFPPGEGFNYSNTGYSLLGIIIGQVSGMSYEQFLNEELLAPAGLTQTGYILPGWQDEDLAIGYLEGSDWGRVVDKNWLEDGPGWHLRANGGLHTTVDDMHRWVDVLRGKGPLNEEQVERWTTGYVDEGMGDSHYAYGWAVHDTEIGMIIAHNGGNGIFSADFVWIPERKFFFYAHGNTSVVEAAQIREEILRAAFDSEFIMPPAAGADPDADPNLASLREGIYLMEDGLISLKPDDIRLLAVVSGQTAINAVFGYDETQVERFNDLNETSMHALSRIRQGDTDALEGLVPAGTDAAARAQGLINFLARYGPVTDLTLIGTVANAPGGRLAHLGDAATLVQADFENTARVLSVIWQPGNTYAGTAMGPLSDIPSFVLIPAQEGDYTGIEREPPFRKSVFTFRGDCLVLGFQEACREQGD